MIKHVSHCHHSLSKTFFSFSLFFNIGPRWEDYVRCVDRQANENRFGPDLSRSIMIEQRITLFIVSIPHTRDLFSSNEEYQLQHVLYNIHLAQLCPDKALSLTRRIVLLIPAAVLHAGQTSSRRALPHGETNNSIGLINCSAISCCLLVRLSYKRRYYCIETRYKENRQTFQTLMHCSLLNLYTYPKETQSILTSMLTLAASFTRCNENLICISR
jgi:hypothetical protein